MRIDRLLFFLRFSKSRGVAQRWIEEGHMRRNGQRVLDNDLAVSVGDILTLPLKSRVVAIEIVTLPTRRGPSEEARSCYRELDAGRPFDIADTGSLGTKGARPSEGKAPK